MLPLPLICIFLCVHYVYGKIQKDYTHQFVNTYYLEWVELGEEDSLKKKNTFFFNSKKKEASED